MVKIKDNLSEAQLSNLGARLKQLRIERGYTNYEQFAFDHELPRAQYGRYEKGQDLRFSSLVKVLAAMEISLKDFFEEGFE
uniref:helix-turn-helix domain-containing protein n=1 Tax=uncultured Draconibacterium sp. TaxID=1573823 RepID=UPI0032176742